MENQFTENQREELSKIEFRIAMIEDKGQDQLYIVLRRLAATFSNDYELGHAVRLLTKSLDEK